jgi:hypothetical protein
MYPLEEVLLLVKHLVLCRIERRPPRLDMTVYPYLPQAHVSMTSTKTYLGLLTRAASRPIRPSFFSLIT